MTSLCDAIMFCCYTTIHVTFQKLSLSFCFPLNLFQSETCVKVHHQLGLWSRNRMCNIIHGCLKSSRFDLSQNYPHFFKQTFEQVCTFSKLWSFCFLCYLCHAAMHFAPVIHFFFLVTWGFKHSKGQTQIPTYTLHTSYIRTLAPTHSFSLQGEKREPRRSIF